MLALVARCGEQILRFPIPRGRVRLGSDPTSDLALPFRGISRQHAFVEPHAGGVRVVDAGSRNGLSFRSLLVPECLLGPGDEVRVGDVWLGVEECDEHDVEPGLSLDLDLRALSARDRGKQLETSVGMPRAAFRVVPALSDLGPRPSLSTPGVEKLLARVCEGLGATAIVVLQGRGREATVRLAVGEALPASELRRLIAEPGGDRPGEPEAAQLFHRSPASGLGILATFPPASRVEIWQEDAFALLAARLLDLPGLQRAPSAPADDARLRLPPGMVTGSSAAMRGLLAQVAATVNSRMDVLLLGETGTGKELFAHLVHASGPTAGGPFVAINCAAIPAELLEAELFGVHGRVATGVDPRIGRLQQAEGGTVFLDEVGELADSLQAKLLRFLQEREIQPLGAPAPRGLNVRVVSASNRDLPSLVREGRFRPDLFFRLSGLQFHVPPLRERREDIPPLVAAIVRKAALEEGKLVRGVNRRALDLLVRYDWPGNVRELENEVRRAVLLCSDGGLLQAEHLGRLRGEAEGAKAANDPAPSDTAAAGLHDQVTRLEQKLVDEALRASGGNKSRAAEALGISRPGLIKMLRRLGGTE